MKRKGRLKPDCKNYNTLIVFLLCIIAITAVLTGCAYDKAYKKGSKLSDRQQYDQAIAELEQAVKLAQEANKKGTVKRYREKLEQVKQEAGRFFYSRAEQQFALTDLGYAQSLIEKCVTYCPQEQPYWVFRQRVNKAIADAEQKRAEALSLAEQKQWKQATDRMNEALAMYKTMPTGQSDLNQIKERAYQYYIALAQEQLQQSDFEEVQTQAQTALTFRENGTEAKSIIKTAQDRIKARELIARGRMLLEQGDCEEALRVFEQARRLHESHPDLPDLLGRARRAVCDKWIAQGRSAMENGDYAQALRLFNKSNQLLTGYAGINALIADVQSRLAQIHLQAAEEQFGNGLAGCAVLHTAMAMGYQPGNYDAAGKLAQYIEHVKQDIRYTIAFAGFEFTPGYRTVAETLDSASLEYLTHLRRMNVALVEAVEMPNESNPTDAQATVTLSVDSPVDAVVSGQVLDVKVISESKRTGYGQSIYQDGYRAEPNPDYAHAAADVDMAIEGVEQARRRVVKAEERLARYDRVDPANPDEMERKRQARDDVVEARRHMVNAASDLAAARIQLSRIPREIMVPNMVNYQYPIETVTRTANVVCMIKIQDVASGELILAERLEGKHVRSDTFVAPDPARNVPGDPLEFPSDSIMLEISTNAVIGELKQSLNAACTRHQQRFLTSIQQAEKAGDVLDLIDNCIKTLFAYPIACDNSDKAIMSLKNCLGQENDLVDIQSLLRTHCQLMLEPAEFPARLEEKDGQLIIRQFYERPTDNVYCPCVLTSIDRQSVHSIAELETLISHYSSQEKVDITVSSSGHSISTQLKLRQRKR